jgi:ATP-dependent RNA helicase DeaD
MVPHSRRRRAEQLLTSAGITARWSTAPAAEEIRAQDRARLLDDPFLSVPPSDEDAALAYQLAERHGAEALAAAFIRLRRQSLPAPMEIAGARAGSEEPVMVPAERTPRDYAARGERPRERPAAIYETEGQPMVWFKTSVGRKNKADPKWLLPLICRLGDVTKRDVGAIRITEHETRFQITEAAAEGFMTSLRDAGENEIRIEQADGPPTETFRPRGDFARPRPPRGEGERPDYARKPRFKPEAGPRSLRSRAKG